ncbi:MAG: hypothetical protein COB98_01655 [Flavobacteriaceae bacterium]|nr:MAG: hypothetical protein COB98_01655 [Flavobacteriaceae bacterium]
MIKDLNLDTFPKDWKVLPFGDVCEISGGSQPPKSTFIYEPKDGYIRLVQVRDYRTSKFITYIPKEKAKKFCSKTDIMIGRYGPPIFGIFRGLEGAYNVALMKAIPNRELLDYEYFYWFLKTDSLVKFVEKTSKRAAGQDGVRKEVLYTYPTPIPPLTQQKQIVAILDKAFAAIGTAKANAEQNLKNAKELFESYLQNVFENKGDDWEERKLDEVCTIISKLIDPKELQYQELIHIGAGNIISEKGTLVDLKTAKEENLISGKFLFDETMVLYSKIRPYLMKIVECDFKGLCSADIYPLSPFKDKVTQSFLFHLLSSSHFTEYAIAGSQRAGMPKVNRKHLFDYSFYCPSIHEQKQIVKKLNALSAETKKLEVIYRQKIADLDELKKSILQKAFSGQLSN